MNWSVLKMKRIEHGFISGAQPALHFGGGILMKFHSMMSSCLFNRCTNFSQTSQIKFSSQHFRKSELFSFNHYAGRTIRTEKISSL